MKKLPYILLVIISMLYIINPTFGVFELLPDNLPLVGNIDEGLFTILLLWSLGKLGVDLPFLKK